ncbi:hypothetical protein [Alteribacter keqinensis]|uniref:Uncharacterized protein n=1 Tax=Alteribacter keqinensis TaxID=2483800 RepID=A0A3M7TQL3_9BACI|nr:hypothetical protein [Alteribacter keqinensis]RNA66979.1 hypothetical protein EBO34_17445 [Alteribacter keqinensis]
MRTLFVVLSLLHVPFLISYIEYYNRFYGELPLTLGVPFLIHIGFAVGIGIISARIPLSWFLIVNLSLLLSHVLLAEWFIAEEHAYWFKPFGPTWTIFLSASFYFAVQGIARWGAFVAKKGMQV